MSFLSRLGLSAVSGVEGPHGTPENLLVIDQPKTNSVFTHALRWVFDFPAFKRYFTSSHAIYIDHSAEYVKLTDFRVDKEGDLIFKDYDCPDCHEHDSGCDHCELQHFSPHHTLDTFFSLLKLQEHTPGYPGLYSIDDDLNVSLWTRSGCVTMPFLAPLGTLPGQYFF